MVDASGHGPLHFACARDSPENLEVLSRLLHWHKEVLAYAGDSVLVDLADKVKGSTPLHVSATAGAALCLRALLHASSCPSHARHVDGFTPLHAAAAAGQYECCRYMLHVAACRLVLHSLSSLFRTIRIILNHCGNAPEFLAARTKSNATALTLAAARGCVDTVRLLLAQGCCEADWDAAAAAARGPAAAFFGDVFAHEFRLFFECPRDAAAACRTMFLDDMGQYVTLFF
jgi:ankyrin repeat protein